MGGEGGRTRGTARERGLEGSGSGSGRESGRGGYFNQEGREVTRKANAIIFDEHFLLAIGTVCTQ